MDNKTFQIFSELIERTAGIHLPEQKMSLLSNRISKRLRVLNLADENDYLKYLKNDRSGDELINLIDVVSTNVTYFYREPKHFEVLDGILSQYAAQGRKTIKIWCAASSSGEEPFTIAMTAAESKDLESGNVRILATDICTGVLNKAVRGIYEEKQLEKTPKNLWHKYLSPVDYEGEKRWMVTPPIKDMVVYKKLNLAEFPYPLKGPIDIIFCRNVMIYFDTPLRARIISEFERLLSPGGYLFLSHSENLLGIEHSFRTHAVAVYRTSEGGAGRSSN